MPAIPVAPNRRSDLASLPVPTTQGIFERGDHVYIQTPVQRFRPSLEEIAEFAFSEAVKRNAPNDNIVWFRGSYVEADRANANGAQWDAQELAIKSLTPMLMPVTVMHDPRTAVGTIADTKLLTPEKDDVSRTRIDTVLALWGHRFPDAVHEAEANASQGSLMQSMECYSPWYECSECRAVYHKLPGGAEQAQWCDHLKASNPNAGFVDLSAAGSEQTSNASRILGDVCFTGTGLIFGTRGARGAYSEAHLESWEDEVASFHSTVHYATASTTPVPRSESRMGLVQIEDSELALLRKERDDARAEATEAKATATTKATEAAAEAQSAIEAAEAKVTAAEAERDAAKAEKVRLEEAANVAALKDQRWGALGEGFVAKLGEKTKAKLGEQAGTMSDEDWDGRLTEVEELVAVKRDATKDGSTTDPAKGSDEQAGTLFSKEEVAAAGATLGGSTDTTTVTDRDRSQVVGSLAGAFRKR